MGLSVSVPPSVCVSICYRAMPSSEIWGGQVCALHVPACFLTCFKEHNFPEPSTQRRMRYNTPTGTFGSKGLKELESMWDGCKGQMCLWAVEIDWVSLWFWKSLSTHTHTYFRPVAKETGSTWDPCLFHKGTVVISDVARLVSPDISAWSCYSCAVIFLSLVRPFPAFLVHIHDPWHILSPSRRAPSLLTPLFNCHS